MFLRRERYNRFTISRSSLVHVCLSNLCHRAVNASSLFIPQRPWSTGAHEANNDQAESFLVSKVRLSDNGAGGRRLVAPGGGEDTDGLVVAGETVDARLDQNEAELGVLVLAVALEVLSDGDGLDAWLERRE